MPETRNDDQKRKITSNQTREKFVKSTPTPLEPRQRNGAMVPLPETWNDDQKINFVKPTNAEKLREIDSRPSLQSNPSHCREIDRHLYHERKLPQLTEKFREIGPERP